MPFSIDGVHVPTGKVISRDLIGTSSSPSRESASGAVAVPAGGRYSLNYNEYVVYSREQVRLRYLVETEFLFDWLCCPESLIDFTFYFPYRRL